ncbi:MAG: DsrE family protein [Phycisphaerales bacterium]|nr:DsrE family protein [Phycisphaerales bacterium]
MKTLLVINRDTMGSGDDTLGARILQTLFGKVHSGVRGIEAIVFYNGGVKVLAEGSPHLPALAAIEQQGVDLIACGTCVDHFDLRERIRIGDIGSMDAILKEMDHADKVITI